MPSIRHTLRFLLNDETVELSDVPATETLLDFLRLDKRMRGSKEGSAEG
jgi:xanthine dehydrogenase small subunit